MAGVESVDQLVRLAEGDVQRFAGVQRCVDVRSAVRLRGHAVVTHVDGDDARRLRTDWLREHWWRSGHLRGRSCIRLKRRLRCSGWACHDGGSHWQRLGWRCVRRRRCLRCVGRLRLEPEGTVRLRSGWGVAWDRR